MGKKDIHCKYLPATMSGTKSIGESASGFTADLRATTDEVFIMLKAKMLPRHRRARTKKRVDMFDTNKTSVIEKDYDDERKIPPRRRFTSSRSK